MNTTILVADSSGAGFWQDNTLEGASTFLGRQKSFFSGIKRYSPEKFELISIKGKGSLVMGYIRLQTEVNELLYNFGELCNIMEEQEKKKLEFIFLKYKKEIQKVKSWAFSAQEPALNMEQIKLLKKIYKLTLDHVRKENYLSRYDVADIY